MELINCTRVSCALRTWQVDPLHWWRGHESQLLKWAKACSLVLLVQPSSTAAERVFSLLSNSFSSRQESSLEDYVELSVMLQYFNLMEEMKRIIGTTVRNKIME